MQEQADTDAKRFVRNAASEGSCSLPTPIGNRHDFMFVCKSCNVPTIGGILKTVFFIEY